jgi:hypothetical protein
MNPIPTLLPATPEHSQMRNALVPVVLIALAIANICFYEQLNNIRTRYCQNQ